MQAATGERLVRWAKQGAHSRLADWLKQGPYEWGMMSPEGNALLGDVVEKGIAEGWSWDRVQAELEERASRAGHGEWDDTSVRENIWQRFKFEED